MPVCHFASFDWLLFVLITRIFIGHVFVGRHGLRQVAVEFSKIRKKGKSNSCLMPNKIFRNFNYFPSPSAGTSVPLSSVTLCAHCAQHLVFVLPRKSRHMSGFSEPKLKSQPTQTVIMSSADRMRTLDTDTESLCLDVD